jgi:flavin reductase (DIM6/NTAB) family NADH-FMN oxidoreductase RutF
MASVTPQMMRDTLRHWASGVSVVTTQFEGQISGMTVSAFNSLSLEPPMILVCLSKDAYTASLILKSRVFGVSILGEGHADISNRFAGRVPNLDHAQRFEGVATMTYESGSPILADSISWLDCAINTIHDGGTHWIVIGNVLTTGCQGRVAPPLIYFNRDYRSLVLPVEERGS